MTRRFQLTALLALAFLMGCTPPSENIVRRTHSAAEEGGHPNVPIHAGQADGASLDPSTHRIISRYGQPIKEYASQYGFDWRTTEYWSPHNAYYLWTVSTLAAV